MLQHFKELALVIKQGAEFDSFEWPRGSSGWNQDFVLNMMEDLGLFVVNVDGCAMGVQDEEGMLIYKPWTVVTTSADVVRLLQPFRCSHGRKQRKFWRIIHEVH